jgi:hypothetical protein
VGQVGSPSIRAGIGDLHINNSDARYEIIFIEAKIDGLLRSLLKKPHLCEAVHATASHKCVSCFHISCFFLIISRTPCAKAKDRERRGERERVRVHASHISEDIPIAKLKLNSTSN